MHERLHAEVLRSLVAREPDYAPARPYRTMAQVTSALLSYACFTVLSCPLRPLLCLLYCPILSCPWMKRALLLVEWV